MSKQPALLNGPETTRDRRHPDERSLMCPRAKRLFSVRDCLAQNGGDGCDALLPYLGCRDVPAFGIQRRQR